VIKSCKSRKSRKVVLWSFALCHIVYIFYFLFYVPSLLSFTLGCAAVFNHHVAEWRKKSKNAKM